MPAFSSLVELIEYRASHERDDVAYVGLSDSGTVEASLTFGELLQRANTNALRLGQMAQPGDRALLVTPFPLDFIVGLFGCLVAGLIAVPMMVPRRSSSRDSSSRIIADCNPAVAITSAQLANGPRKDVISRFVGGRTQLLILDGCDPAVDAERASMACPRSKPDDIAFLQYTSGSTSDPKGVMVSHANVLANLEMIRIVLDNTEASTCVSWVPLYHDMGLIVNVLESLYVGALCVLLTPTSFLQRPLLWLRAIHEYRAKVTGGPNFAFDLCADRLRPEQLEGVDLSSWEMAFNAAEPIRADTIERFSRSLSPFGFDPRAVSPGYGMAEATLLISGRRRGTGPLTRAVSRSALRAHRIAAPESDADAQMLVGSGPAVPEGRIAIVDPDTRRRLPTCSIGEIWAAGAHIAQGYWQAEEATRATFRMRIEEERDDIWLRTGDLGFLDENGELFVTGRIKDIIIVRGINHYPQDIERTVQRAHPALRKNCGAAFSVMQEQAGEKVIVVQEIERTWRLQIDVDEIVGLIREAVANEHEFFLHEVVLIRTGTLPKTTSGKIQRGLTRQLWQQGQLEPAHAEQV